MSWQAYVDSNLLGTGKIVKAAIHGRPEAVVLLLLLCCVVIDVLCLSVCLSVVSTLDLARTCLPPSVDPLLLSPMAQLPRP